MKDLKKKEKEKKYLKDARERQKGNYISVKNISRTEIEKRRAVRERVRKSRAAAKERIGQAKRIEGTLATTNDNTQQQMTIRHCLESCRHRGLW